MKTLTLVLLALGSSAFAQNKPTSLDCPQWSGVYYRANSHPRLYSLFIQAGCQKLDIKVLGENDPEIYFSVPVIGEPLSTDSTGGTFQAYWKNGQLFSEASTNGQVAVYKLNLHPFEDGVVQISDYELRSPTGEKIPHHEIVTWIRVN
jgi:hypothetical protein